MAEVLTLKTGKSRRRIVIDDADYFLLDMSEVPLATGIRINATLEKIRGYETMDEAKAEALSAALRRAVQDVVLNITSEVDDKLSDGNRIDIVLAFLTATGELAPKTAESLQPSGA